MSDYEPIIFSCDDKIQELERRITFLKNENIRLNTLLNDKLTDIEMELHMLKCRLR